MYVDFNTLPSTARVWFYQADRDLNKEEIGKVEEGLKESLDGWNTHGSPMRGAFKVFYNRIVILGADISFQEPSGCSIDSSARWLKVLGDKIGVSFFDRDIGYFVGDKLRFFSVFEGKKLISGGGITEETVLVNHQIATVADVLDQFNVKAKDSFLARHFQKRQEVVD